MEKDEIFQKLLSQKSKLIIYGNDGNECTDTHGDAFIYIYILKIMMLYESGKQKTSAQRWQDLWNALFFTMMMTHTCLC